MNSKKPSGMSNEAWEALVEWGREMSEAIETRTCPDCRGPLTRMIPTRFGVAIQLNWVHYRCTPPCAFMIERYEEPAPDDPTDSDEVH